MASKINVLVFPCGSENASEIYDALRYSLHVNLFGASSVEDYGRLNFDNYISDVPFIDDDKFEGVFKKIVDDYNIDVVFATHDSVAVKLSKIRDKNYYLVNGNERTCEILRSKNETYRLFSHFSWCPDVYDLNSPEAIVFPLIAKPDQGQGGNGVTLIRNQNDLLQISQDPGIVLVEYLPGEEATIDCFTDRQGTLIYSKPRTRARIRAGIAMQSEVFDDEILDLIANKINEKITFRGPWFFQMKKNNDGFWKLLEISCRVAGTMVAQRAHGINLPLLAIQDYKGRNISCIENPFLNKVERRIVTKGILEYEFDNIYVDLDDTLILSQGVCADVISLIYQAKNDAKNIILITRHEQDVTDTLRKYHIAQNLFDEIIHLKSNESKADYIKDKSIFIDNFFNERQDVFNRLSIPCFDTDSVSFLLR
ncbi:ATP-grasp domain-containing protein [Kluyvera genomosp. 1]|uniref:ATP-grasp domain-containing protein n=1 Tax=Kluyvera genomosp. 1 TaxID=2774053 RepID=UPI00068F4492|nr:ATP-grasp domain-containing protein [Kluyvera genomosp. 1]